MHNYAWSCIIMHNYGWLYITMHNYARLCIIMHDYAWLCIIMYDYAYSCMIWAHFSILRFCHGLGQIKRWGAVRHVIVSGISMRVFLKFFIFSQKKTVLRRLDVSCLFDVSKKRFLKKWLDPKVSQKCLGPLWAHPRPILDHFRPILTEIT